MIVHKPLLILDFFQTKPQTKIKDIKKFPLCNTSLLKMSDGGENCCFV